MATRLLIKIDASKIEGLGAKLGQISGEDIGQAVVASLNTVVDRTYDLARERMVASVNLDDAYMRRKMTVVHATGQKPEAKITASGGRESMTTLARYGAKMVLAPRKSKRARPTTGGLNLPSGTRQKAVEVRVNRDGGGATLLYGFMQPLRAGMVDGGNGMGVFARNKQGEKVHRYGPAVYQLFKTQIPNIEDEVGDDLSDTLADAVEEHMRKELA